MHLIEIFRALAARSWLIGLLVLAGQSLWIPTAKACGGFFCSNLPIDQSAERIAFAVDQQAGEIEAHVQIFYQGPADEFAWIVPVPSPPELFISSDTLFDQLDINARPYFWLDWREEGTCTFDDCLFSDLICAPTASTESPDFDTGSDPTVEVVSEGQVGDYDTVVLRADDAQVLLTWLQDRDFQLPDTLSPVLDPYVAQDSYFVAIRLQKDKDTGDIAPLGMRYEADQPMIPIQLTSIAATPNMRLEVYIFGEQRAVPENYLHVVINEAAIDWLSGGSNYDAVVTAAADEAGGHAFATDYAGSTEFLRGLLYDPERLRLDGLSILTDPAQFLDELLRRGFPRGASMQNLIRRHIPMPESARQAGISENQFYNCLSCYAEHLVGLSFDPAAFVSDLEIKIIEPLERAERLVNDYPQLTRLTSSVSPEEMTVDPTFALNSDLGEVSNIHRADLVILCGDGLLWDEAPRRIELEDGRVIELPSPRWLAENGQTAQDILEDLAAPAAAQIQSTGAQGEPSILVDNTLDVDQAVDQHNRRVRALDPDDGCVSGSMSPWTTAWLGLAVVWRRRKRRARG